MTKTEQFNARVAAIPDAELAEKCSKALSKLCETGGKSFKMCIPPMVNDTDILFSELIKRFERRDKWTYINGKEENLPEPGRKYWVMLEKSDHPLEAPYPLYGIMSKENNDWWLKFVKCYCPYNIEPPREDKK